MRGDAERSRVDLAGGRGYKQLNHSTDEVDGEIATLENEALCWTPQGLHFSRRGSPGGNDVMTFAGPLPQRLTQQSEDSHCTRAGKATMEQCVRDVPSSVIFRQKAVKPLQAESA